MDMKEVWGYAIAAIIVLAVAVILQLTGNVPFEISGIFGGKKINLTANINGSNTTIPLSIDALKGTNGTSIRIGNRTYSISTGNETTSVKLPGEGQKACNNTLFTGGSRDSYSFAITENNGTALTNVSSRIGGNETLLPRQTTPVTASAVEPASTETATSAPQIAQQNAAGTGSNEYIFRETQITTLLNTPAGTLVSSMTKKSYLASNTLSCVFQTVNGSIGSRKISEVMGCENSLPEFNPYTMCADDLRIIGTESVAVGAGSFSATIYAASNGTTYWASNIPVPIRIRTNTSTLELVSYEKGD